MPARSKSPSRSSFDVAKVDAILQAALQKTETPGGAIAIVRDDEVLYLAGCGVKEIGTDDPVTPDTVFAIASTTKAFTTTAIAMLVDEGKMAWDDPVRRHVPFFRLQDPLADANVTLRDLVCHRTGMSRHDLLWYRSPFSREEIIRKIGLVGPSSSFRSKYEYQNIMYMTAGYAVGAASGGTWEEFVQARIFAPLEMAAASFRAADARTAPDHATPHQKRKADKKAEKVGPIPWLEMDSAGPAGSINASARDLSRWVRMQLAEGEFEGKRLISAEKLAETRSPQMIVPLDDDTRALYPDTTQISYGLGWSIQDYRGHLLVSHGGAIDGFRSMVALAPRSRLGIVVLGNLGGTWLPEAARNSLLDLLLDVPTQDWNAPHAALMKKAERKQKDEEKAREAKRHKKTRPSRELAAYAGEYEDPAYGTATVSRDKGALRLQYHGFDLRLTHFHYDTFRAKSDAPPVDESAVFTLGEDGEVAEMRVMNIAFKKVPPERKDEAKKGPNAGTFSAAPSS